MSSINLDFIRRVSNFKKKTLVIKKILFKKITANLQKKMFSLTVTSTNGFVY